MRLHKRDRRRRDGEDGVTMAEFALILPVIVVIMVSIFEFGLAFHHSQAIEAAAREGARLASLSSTSTTDVSNRVDAALTGIYSPGTVTVAVNPDPAVCLGRPGQQVQVTVTANEPIDIPLLFNTTVTLTGDAIFRCEL
jgi:Flp pilus assembly protein TadG